MAARMLTSFEAILLLWFLLVSNWIAKTMTDGEVRGIMIIASMVSIGIVCVANGVQMWLTDK